MNYSIENEIHTITSTTFKNLTGSGNSFDEAMIEFWNGLYIKLNSLISKGHEIPSYYSSQKDINKAEKKSSFQLTPNVALKILIYEKMKEKGITSDFMQKKSIEIDKLLDVKHQSTVWELEQAFRVLDYFLNFNITPVNN